MPPVSLGSGSRLGPYEIVAPLGSGGMGEVYRAIDPRLGREVAIKVLPPLYTRDPDRLRRFEQEARAAAALNHPNILAVHDIGTDAGCPYVVSELLEGETLRERLNVGRALSRLRSPEIEASFGVARRSAEGAKAAGPPTKADPIGSALPVRKAIDYAVQIVHGLAAAHDKGIVHRDLKPENVFVTRDGRIKIIDFGLAKLIEAPQASIGVSAMPTVATPTDAGIILGTVGYMAPEQVRGEPSDSRCDIFAVGAILFEMLTGRRAFSGESAPETMTAILRADPLDLPDAARVGAPALQRIVRHCLEKNPHERFQSARDLAFDLESLADASEPARVGPLAIVRRRRATVAAVAALVVTAVAVGGFFFGQRTASREPPTFQQLTFRRGSILAARFASNGQTILYGAAWDNQPLEVFSTQPGSAESRPLGLPPDSEILAVSSKGELAVSLRRRFLGSFIWTGTLARVGLAGGTPRELVEDIQLADWDPAGSDLAVVREVAGRSRLEFPVGRVLYETGGWIGQLRVSSRGDAVAFIDHPIRGDDAGSVAIVDLAGRKRDLSDGWISIQGVAWSGDEIWFTGTKTGSARALYAVTTNGALRPLMRVAGALTLHDVIPGGGVLFTRDEARLGMAGVAAGEPRERDLSWLDWSLIRDLSGDATTLLFDETGEGGGPRHGVYLRRMDGSPAVRLGDGIGMALSPDGKLALSIESDRNKLVLLPTGTGQSVSIPTGNVLLQRAGWFPDGKRLLIAGNEPAHGIRLFVKTVGDSQMRPISPEGMSAARFVISPDGRLVAARGPDGRVYLYPVDDGMPQAIAGIGPSEILTRWTKDGHALYVYDRGRLPITIYRVDVRSGERAMFKETLEGAGSTGFGVANFTLSEDGNTYAYTYVHVDSALFLVNGVK